FRSTPQRIKEFFLRREVILHCAVIIEVILREVGEDADVEFNTADTLLFERVRADFHDASLAVSAQHLRHHLLDFERLGRGALRRNDALADLVSHRANQAAVNSRGFHNLFHHESHGGLAVRAGDTNDPQLFAWMLVVSRGHTSQSFARIGNFDFCGALRDEAVLFADDRRRAAVDGGADEAVSIRLLSWHGHKDHSRRHPARGISKAFYLAVQPPFDET